MLVKETLTDLQTIQQFLQEQLAIMQNIDEFNELLSDLSFIKLK